MIGRILPACTMVALLFSGTAMAAPITWQAPTAETGNTSDVVTTGSFVGSAVAYTSDVTVGGVTFDGESSFAGGVLGFNNGSDVSLSNISVPYAVYGTPTNTWNAAYQSLVGSGAYNTAQNVVSITLSGLTVGDAYTVQIFEAFWNFNWATSYSAGGNTSVPVNLTGGNVGAGASVVPEYLLGTFTANTSTETITLSSNTEYVVFDALQLRDDGVPVPETASLTLLAMGLASLAVVRRRQV